MAEDNPITGRPHGGRDEKDEDDTLPGEHRVSDEESTVGPPPNTDPDDDTASRAAESGPMTSDGSVEPTPGVPGQLHANDSADATEGEPSEGRAANQQGRTPRT